MNASEFGSRRCRHLSRARSTSSSFTVPPRLLSLLPELLLESIVPMDIFSALISSDMISNKDRSEDSLPCVADFGVTLYFLLCNACFRRRLSTSFKALFIASVSLSANKTASPLLFLAALPIICIKLLDDLANPETSASNMATNETRGKSKPSRSN